MQLRLLTPVLLTLLMPSAASAQAAPALDGGIYSGALVDGLRQGPGDIRWPNGIHYQGGFEKGLMSGKGRIELPGGKTYEGEFRQGLMHGKGRFVSPREFTYEGDFRNNLFAGTGQLESDGLRYEGEFRDSMFWGKGKETLKRGDHYSGDFVEGKYQGQGRYETKDGRIYEGEFDKGEFTGQGRILYKNGSRYEGRIKDWLADGQGTLTMSDGESYKGNFKDDQIIGKGEMLAGKLRYEGEFRDLQPHGEGTMYLANGDIYSGHFLHSMYHGKGILTYAKPREDGRKRDIGIWEYGRLQDKAAAQKSAADIEAALYRQSELLQSALAGIKPGTAAQTDLFFLGIAGDGDQEVFRRETGFVRKMFDQDFGSAGHSLNLVNSRSTLLEQPLATNTSIRMALETLASRMNKDEDILFIYMTSHGSRKKEFILNPVGMELANLGADEFGKLLKASGIRWKVIVISACYSGGFLDALKDDGTLVITAARHDRTSFGCSDENDFTYFGRAYFKEALPDSGSFQQAFEKSSQLVREWESRDMQEDGKIEETEFSLPQIQNPTGIEKKLKAWWPEMEKRRSTPGAHVHKTQENLAKEAS